MRRTLLWVCGGVAVAALLMAILVTVLAVQSAAVWLTVAIVVLLLAIVAEVVLLFLGAERAARTPRKPAGGAEPHAGPAAQHPEGNLLLRCSACSRTFTTFDAGHRPLATLCPHCGQRGVIDAPIPG